jgi:hypothetical protein
MGVPHDAPSRGVSFEVSPRGVRHLVIDTSSWANGPVLLAVQVTEKTNVFEVPDTS